MAGEDWSGLLPEMPTGQDKPSLVPEPRRTAPGDKVLGPGGGSGVGANWLGEQAVSGAALSCCSGCRAHVACLLPAPGRPQGASCPQCKAAVSPVSGA